MLAGLDVRDDMAVLLDQVRARAGRSWVRFLPFPSQQDIALQDKVVERQGSCGLGSVD